MQRWENQNACFNLKSEHRNGVFECQRLKLEESHFVIEQATKKKVSKEYELPD